LAGRPGIGRLDAGGERRSAERLVGRAPYLLGLIGQLESIIEADRSHELDRDSFFANWNLIRAHSWAGHFDRALATVPGVLRESGRNQWALGLLAWIYWKSGDGARARAVYDEMEGRSRHEFVAPFWLAVAAASAGLQDQGIHVAERAIVERDPLVTWGRAMPFWDPFRTHPRFDEVVRGVWR
jgi:hypothetical protein